MKNITAVIVLAAGSYSMYSAFLATPESATKNAISSDFIFALCKSLKIHILK